MTFFKSENYVSKNIGFHILVFLVSYVIQLILSFIFIFIFKIKI
jgi:hypothetical protein